jgi:hypothetical protein
LNITRNLRFERNPALNAVRLQSEEIQLKSFTNLKL